MEELLEGVAPAGRTKKVQVLRASAARDPLSESGEWRTIKVNDPALIQFVRSLAEYGEGKLPNATNDPALAGLAGALLGVTQGFDYQIGFKLLLLIFAAVVLGGLGTIWGAIVGAFVIGIFVELTTLVVPAEFKFVGALLVLIVVLLFRPQGLLGKAQRIG
jgi:hypothetical protein